MFLALLPNFMFIPSITVLANYFNTSFSIMQLSVSIFMVVSAFLQMLLGPLSDKYGRRPVLLICLLILIFASLGCIFSTSKEMFFFFRILQASAVSGLVIGRALVVDIFPQKDSIKIFSQIAIILGVSSIIGPGVGGFLIQISGWQAIFYFIITIAFLSLGYNYTSLEETNPHLITNVKKQIANYKMLIVEKRFWIYSMIGGFSSSTFFTILISAPFIGEIIYDMKPFQSSLLLIIITSGFILGSFICPNLLIYLSEKKILILSIISSLLGATFSFALYSFYPENILSIFGPFFFIGLSNGFISPIALSKVLSIRDDSRGAASGLNGAFIIGFGAFYSAVSGFLLGYVNKTEIIYYMIFLSLFLTYFAIFFTDQFYFSKDTNL